MSNLDLVYADNIVYSLKHASDYNFQKQTLLNPTGPYVWIFHEDYDAIYEDNGLEVAWKKGKIVFSKEADAALLDLAILMLPLVKEQSKKNIPDRILVDMPEMDIIRQKAAFALKLVRKAMAKP